MCYATIENDFDKIENRGFFISVIHLLSFVHRVKTGMLTAEKDNTLQMKGNSGIMLQSRYEVQVLDCEDNPTYGKCFHEDK